MKSFFVGIDIVLEICCWIVVAFAALDLLGGYGAIDPREGRLAALRRYLDKATASALWPIRRLMPSLGGVDLSPIILIVVLMTIRYTIALYAVPKFA